MKRAVIRSLRFVPSAPAVACCLSPTNSIMVSRKLMLLVILSTLLCVSCLEETSNFNRKNAQEQALKAYRSACLRLQNMANWMSVFLKLKSAWTNTTTNNMMATPDYKEVIGFVNLPKLPERPSMGKYDGNISCNSLKNFQVTLQTFLHYQAQHLQLKAVLANIFLQSSRSRIEETNETLKKRIGNLESLNKTLADVFEKLKLSQILSAQATLGESNILYSFGDALKNLNISFNHLKPQNGILRQIQSAINTTQERKWTRTLFQTGDFFQNLGLTLDRFFMSNIAV